MPLPHTMPSIHNGRNATTATSPRLIGRKYPILTSSPTRHPVRTSRKPVSRQAVRRAAALARRSCGNADALSLPRNPSICLWRMWLRSSVRSSSGSSTRGSLNWRVTATATSPRCSMPRTTAYRRTASVSSWSASSTSKHGTSSPIRCRCPCASKMSSNPRWTRGII